jgi:hypothetical protein
MRARLGVGLIALGVAGCAPPPPVVRPYPAPTAEALTATLAARQHALAGMSARVRATSWLGGDRVRATVNMLVERNGRLRFEAEVTLEGTVATLVTDGPSFALLDARRNELSRGPACPANVASLIRIPLAPAEVAAVLLGDARLPEPATGVTPTVSWDPRRGADVLAMRDQNGGTLRLFFRGPETRRDLIAAVRSGPDGAALWQTSYESFESLSGRRLPGTIRFAERDTSFDDGVEIRFKDRSFDEPPPGAFAITAPAGVVVKEVGCGSGP